MQERLTLFSCHPELTVYLVLHTSYINRLLSYAIELR